MSSENVERVETLMGLEVSDDAGYARYREGMEPILKRYGGGFGYDFVVSRVLRSQTAKPINRVFTIYFPSIEQRTAFFNDEAYLAVKRQHFVAAVAHVTQLAQFERKAQSAR